MEYLYLIRCNEFVKIGVSYDVEERLSSLQTGSPYSLAILDKFEFADAALVERTLHKRFADARVNREWFKLSDTDIAELTEICRRFDGVRPIRTARPSAKPRQQFLDLSTLPTEKVLAEEEIKIVPTVRVERRGDRYPVGFAVYQRGKPVYVSYVSEERS